jgi:CubicO group peptidase (beta-lactamase class C family)
MGHRSGIRDGKGYGKFVSAMRETDVNLRELFSIGGQYFSEDMFAEHRVGEYFSYSNSSWGLVATVIEKVSGMRFDQFLKKKLLEPMGMNASFNLMDIPYGQIASLYRVNEENEWVVQADDVVNEKPKERSSINYEIGTNGLIYGPQGSLRASVNDLFQVAKLLMNAGNVGGKQILKASTVDILSNDKWVYNGSNGDTWDNFWMAYGKGLQSITNTPNADVLFPDRTMIGHPGIAYGLLSDLYVDPETKSGIIFITNGSKQSYKYGPTTSFYEVEEALFKILYPYLKSDL